MLDLKLIRGETEKVKAALGRRKENVDIDQVVLVNGLKYNAKDKTWGGTKIYDPSKGIKVNVTAEFETPEKLKLRGTILGVGVTLYWVRIQ